ncbi:MULTISPECIES: hypothetical protein [unclassified Streptomyces]|uniref:hypothetical protein n=1 Tax=unclassified Streptomyces TaxID=2593676 RepID=UPI003D7141DF
MLRITDARTGADVPAAPVRRGLTRVEAHADGCGTGDLRVLLVADLLVRALELGGTPVWGLLTGRGEQTRLRTDADELGIRPFEDNRDMGTGLGEAQVVHVARRASDVPDGVVVAVAPVDGPPLPSAGPPDRAEPAALRLALLTRPRDTPVRLTAADLAEARDTLVRWRQDVARWARQPSRPVPEEVRGRLRAAWEDDLDVPEVLRVLRRIEQDPDVAPGARFETHAYADRLLGLDLTRDLGSPV